MIFGVLVLNTEDFIMSNISKIDGIYFLTMSRFNILQWNWNCLKLWEKLIFCCFFIFLSFSLILKPKPNQVETSFSFYQIQISLKKNHIKIWYSGSYKQWNRNDSYDFTLVLWILNRTIVHIRFSNLSTIFCNNKYTLDS